MACEAMPRRGALRPHPSDYLAAGEPWLEGTLGGEAPPEARLAQAISRRLHERLEQQGLSLRAAAQLVGTSTTALHDLLHGRAWSGTATLARLERGLRTDLWGGEHRM